MLRNLFGSFNHAAETSWSDLFRNTLGLHHTVASGNFIAKKVHNQIGHTHIGDFILYPRNKKKICHNLDIVIIILQPRCMLMKTKKQ